MNKGKSMPSHFQKIIVSSCFIFSNSLSAAVNNDISELDYLADDPIIVSSATRLKQELRDVPGSITIIDRQMIEASSATKTVELLRLVPGFQVGSNHGNETTVTYHGMSGEHNTRLHILINGRSVYDPMFGGALWYSIPVTIDEVESIEVIRGPNASSYGANSFSGVVNIKTYNPKEFDGTTVSLNYGHQRETKRLRALHSGQYDDINYRVSFEHEYNEGFPNSQWDRDPLLDVYDDATHTQFNSQFEYISKAGNTHSFEFGIKEIDLGGGFTDLGEYGIPKRDKTAFSFYENYIWQKQPSLLKSHKVQISHSYLDYKDKEITFDGEHDNTDHDVPYDDCLIVDPDDLYCNNLDKDKTNPAHPINLFDDGLYNVPSFKKGGYKNDDYKFGDEGESHPLSGEHIIYQFNDFKDQRFDIEYEQSSIHSPSLQTVWGGGLRYDIAETSEFSYLGGQSVSRTSARLFGHVEWKAHEKLLFNVGGLLESYEKLDPLFSPRLAANFHFNKQNTFRANISKVYADRSNYDDAAATLVHDNLTIGNPELKAEKIESYEIGYLGQFYKNKIQLDLRLSKEFITDNIDLRKTKNGKRSDQIVRHRFLNYGELEIDSVELELRVKPSKKTQIIASASYANAYGYYANTTNDNGTVNKTVYNAYRYVPLLSTGILASHQFDNQLNASMQYNFVEAYTTYGAGDDLDALETFDIKLSKSFKFNKNPIKVTTTIKNIFDNDYQDFDESNLVGMEAYLELKMDFN